MEKLSIIFVVVFIISGSLSSNLLEDEIYLLLDSSTIQETIDDIITPSDTCKEIVAQFGSAISNFTLCSVTNARPIHLCQWCIHQYLRVVETHQDFVVTIDEKEKRCKEYFTNLDRIEITAEWEKGNRPLFTLQDGILTISGSVRDASELIIFLPFDNKAINVLLYTRPSSRTGQPKNKNLSRKNSVRHSLQFCRSNADSIGYVTDAYKYVHNLWTKGKCDYCFRRNANGSIIDRATEEAVMFDLLYQMTKSCFDRNIDSNETCNLCKVNYNNFNNYFIEIGERNGENICLDIVDTMNTTREIWTNVFKCFPNRKKEMWLHFGMAVVGIIPIVFYCLTFLLSNVQESNVLHQSRLVENISGSSGSAGSYGARIIRRDPINSASFS